ncbi:hypothetical protein BGZ74_002666, partial [Mortierella antarctica]
HRIWIHQQETARSDKKGNNGISRGQATTGGIDVHPFWKRHDYDNNYYNYVHLLNNGN